MGKRNFKKCFAKDWLRKNYAEAILPSKPNKIAGLDYPLLQNNAKRVLTEIPI